VLEGAPSFLQTAQKGWALPINERSAFSLRFVLFQKQKKRRSRRRAARPFPDR